MTAKWVFEYFTAPSTWTAFTAKLKNTNEILNGHEEALLSISNNVANRAFVASNQTVRVKYDGDVVFTGLLSALEYGTTILNCVLYNETLEKLKTVTYTASFPTGAGADTILAAVCALAGVTAGTCPSTSIAVRFDETSCYDVVMFLKDCLNSDVWTVGAVVNIGTRGSAKTVTYVKIKSRGIDRSKLRDKVRVKGMDASSNEIIGEAGSGDKVKVYREKKANDVTTLNTLAAKYLDELNTVSKGAPIEVPINEAHELYPGDTFSITNARYNLSGSYKIMSISKYPSKAAIQLDKPAASLEAKLLDFKKYEDIGIYQITGAGEALEPVTLTYQGLELYQLLDEGSDIYISDYSPHWRQGIGYHITWADSDVGKLCAFNGIDSFINEGSTSTPKALTSSL